MFVEKLILTFHIPTHSDSGMVMTLQLTRIVVMMAKLNMGWVNTMRAILLIGWKGERSHSAFVAENLIFSFRKLIFSFRKLICSFLENKYFHLENKYFHLENYVIVSL